MTSRTPETYRSVAEAAWRWVLDQVRWGDDGPWIPVSVTDPPDTQGSWVRDGFHSGIGGLAYVLAEVRLGCQWSREEQRLADAIADRLRVIGPGQTDCSFFDGLASTVGALIALDVPGAEGAVARLATLAEPDGWPQTVIAGPRYLPGARVEDVVLGTAGILLAMIWAHRHGVSGADEVAEHAAAVLLADAEQLPTGINWQMVPPRFHAIGGGGALMPNFSHGVAGVAASLAVAGAELGRPDLTTAALSGAEHLVSLGDAGGEGFVVPRYLPPDINDQDEITHSWCHGGTGTSLLFLALDYAGVAGGCRPGAALMAPQVSPQRPDVRAARAPAPRVLDNDGRCCGTAGVADVFLDSWQRSGDDQDLDFALHLADALAERSVNDGARACWRFIEHHNADPLLPPGVGWMQGAAGISAFLFRISRAMRDGRAADPVPRMDTWWALPPAVNSLQDQAL